MNITPILAVLLAYPREWCIQTPIGYFGIYQYHSSSTVFLLGPWNVELLIGFQTAKIAYFAIFITLLLIIVGLTFRLCSVESKSRESKF